jgi:hypothetical protein
MKSNQKIPVFCNDTGKFRNSGWGGALAALPPFWRAHFDCSKNRQPFWQEIGQFGSKIACQFSKMRKKFYYYRK